MTTFTFDTGSVISGTMRHEDLIPEFIRLLDEAGEMSETFQTIKADYEKDDYFDGEFVGEDLDALFDYLQDYAPEGCYFGAHPGDGSDYGFWYSEDYDPDESEDED